MEDEVRKQVKYMIWYNILHQYSEDQILGALSDVFRKHRGREPEASEYEEVILTREKQKKSELSNEEKVFRNFSRRITHPTVIDSEKTKQLFYDLIMKVKKFIIDYRCDIPIHNAFKKRNDVMELMQLREHLNSSGFNIDEDILEEVIG